MRRIILLALLGLAACSPPPYKPAIIEQTAAGPKPVVIRDDMGGYITPRVLDIQRLNENRVPVRIEGSVCASSCTLYLGARDVCIEKTTSFLFHGPGSSGTPLSPEERDLAVRVIAAHYPSGLRDWYLGAPSRKTLGFASLPASQIHAQGIPYCE